MCIYIHICIDVCICNMYVYIYIYICLFREREMHMSTCVYIYIYEFLPRVLRKCLYGVVTMISPTIISGNNNLLFVSYLARGVKFNVLFEFQGFV